jgi:isocitrate dehydrogenase kinase/phosphatase
MATNLPEVLSDASGGEIGPWQVAVLLLRDFSAYRQDFQTVTGGARTRFEASDWLGAQTAARARIQLYSQFRAGCLQRLTPLVEAFSSQDWATTRRYFESLTQGLPDRELAQTGYNTIFRKLVGRKHLSHEQAFVRQAMIEQAPLESFETFQFDHAQNLSSLVEMILLSFPFDIPFARLGEDIMAITALMTKNIKALKTVKSMSAVMLRSVFYRNKGAYLIGRLSLDNRELPLAFALNNERGFGISVDSVLWNEKDLSRIFSFTRAYFMVNVNRPASFVQFLNGLMPAKKPSELYSSLGYYKHGKTTFYAELSQHLGLSKDLFVKAEGIEGLVMLVFTLASHQVVFKVIRDRFPPSKKVTPTAVKQAYHLVKTHDRVGRMADTHEFLELRLPASRFDDEVLQTLLTEASHSVSLIDDDVVLRHVYAERLMTPLNLYLKNCTDAERDLVIDDYGLAIKQLAAANIFPGDMLPKNFGVTRHGRVIFYDYDEICYLTDVKFRTLPDSNHENASMGQEPWFEVGEFDVFPEEFEHFLLAKGPLLKSFSEKHGDLFNAEYWQSVQNQLRAQTVLDVFPYRLDQRLSTATTFS